MVTNHRIFVSLLILTAVSSIVLVLILLFQFTWKHEVQNQPSTGHSPLSEEVDVVSTTLPPLIATSSVWFLGDTMLSRQVGEFASQRGLDFPFRMTTEAWQGSYVVANFESCLSETKRFSKEQSMRFPVDPRFATTLAALGITHVSLANNHALDCGPDDYHATRNLFRTAGIAAFGHPTLLNNLSVTYLTVGKKRVALIGIHTLFSVPTESDIAAVVASSSANSDLQIAFVHWGNEYELVASKAQRDLATQLVAYGVDLVIGHHPHVTQNIDSIDGVLVVYSLGNFVFDQYFSQHVQEGLTLKLELGSTSALTLHPVTSIGSKTQPRFMDDTERAVFLRALAARSTTTLEQAILHGTIPLQF